MRNNTIIKAFLFLLALASMAVAKAQDPCEITCNVDQPVCSGTAVTLSVPNNYQYLYQWSTGQTSSSITVRPSRTDYYSNIHEVEYSVTVFDQDTTELCTSSIAIGVKPIFKMGREQLKYTCSNRNEENGRTAQVMVWVDSLEAIHVPPFNYQWEISPMHIAPGDPTWAIGLEAYKYYYIKITDGRGCTQRDSVWLKAYPNPVIDVFADPGDTVYLQNPHVTYSFENRSADSIPLSNFYWVLNSQYNITSTEEEPRFTYVDVGDYNTELKVYNPQGCDTSYYKNIRVEPVKLKIPNVFTPDGNNVNDYFIISVENGDDTHGNNGNRETHYEYEDYEPLSRYYESSELTIFNRWGRIVYHSKDYRNDWDGGGLSDGTYFYVLKCHGLKNDATYQGTVMIIKTHKGM